MYSLVLSLHNILRWLVVLSGLWAFFSFLFAWLGKRPFTAAHARACAFYTWTLNLQFLIGFLLYVLLSPITRMFWSNPGAGMRDPLLRYFGLEHILAMIAAVALASIGAGRSRRGTDPARLRTGAIFFGLSVLMIAARVPWASRPLFRWFTG